MSNSRILLATLVAALLAAAPVATAQEEPTPTSVAAGDESTVAEAPQPDLESLLWVARPLVVFADSENDPRFTQQLRMIEEGAADLEERRVVVLTDADPAAAGPLRRALRPRGFGVVLIDTDGSVVQRRPSPTTVREFVGTIDRLPSRREETGSRRP